MQHHSRSTLSLFVILTMIAVGPFGVMAQSVSDPTSGNPNVNVDPVVSQPVSSPEVDVLNQQIDEKRRQVDELKRQSAIYEQQLERKQNERATLAAQLNDLRDAMQQAETELQLNQTELAATQLELQRVEQSVAASRDTLARRQDELAVLLRQVHETDQVSQLELVVQEPSFSSFFQRTQQLHDLSSAVEQALRNVRSEKAALEADQAELETKRQALDATQEQLQTTQHILTEQTDYQASLVDEVRSSESQYQSLLSELKSQAASVDTEITGLIQQVNDRLAARGQTIEQVAGPLSWPVDPSRGISAYFHDPTYPFRKIFEHPAIDIRATHGTPVVAAADGVVAIARKLDWVRDTKGRILWPAYNFVTIVHAGGLATVYGHLSVVSVSEGQTVKRGEVIGKSGATPGTAGAGRLTTGPHLHFEVRVNGLPDDPLKYLPSLDQQGTEQP